MCQALVTQKKEKKDNDQAVSYHECHIHAVSLDKHCQVIRLYGDLVYFSFRENCSEATPSCVVRTNKRNTLRPSGCPYYSKPCVTIRMRWLWGVFLIIVTPNLLSFLRCLWAVMFKRTTSPTKTAFLIVSLIYKALLHVV